MAKGKNYEREISKDMSLWLTNGKNKDAVWYTKGSGARATRRIRTNQKSKQFDHGDLAPDSSDVEYFFKTFSCELKTGYGKKGKKQTTLWSLLDLIDSKQDNPMFNDFWAQTANDATESNREPILIFRRNRRQSCIAMYDYIFKTFVNCQDKDINFNTININYTNEYNTITICNIKHFFNYTWGKINENFIKLKMNRAILLYLYGGGIP